MTFHIRSRVRFELSWPIKSTYRVWGVGSGLLHIENLGVVRSWSRSAGKLVLRTPFYLVAPSREMAQLNCMF